MKYCRNNKRAITRCLDKYVEESNCDLISKHYEYDKDNSDILVYCVIGYSKYGSRRTFPLVLSGISLCLRFNEPYEEV